MCSKFNNYFIESIEEIINSITPPKNIIYNIESNDNIFKFTMLENNQLLQIINNIKCKSDINHINSKVLIDIFEYIGESLLILINKSLLEGKFPDSWKISNIIPVPKIKNTLKAEEFRPINICFPHMKK